LAGKGTIEGYHFAGAPSLPPPTFSISQNPTKNEALATLPPVAALLLWCVLLL
jgi:hypothetical protein